MGCLTYKFTSPGNVGVPDRIVVLPDGSVIFVELKTDVGVLSKAQELQIARLRSNNAVVTVVKGMAGADDFCDTVRYIIEDSQL